MDAVNLDKGLSPRVRGNRKQCAAAGSRERSIPACAGEPLASMLVKYSKRVYPRVCGGTDITTRPAGLLLGLSPRVRGNRVKIALLFAIQGSIPACAGEPLVVKLLILLPLQIKL